MAAMVSNGTVSPLRLVGYAAIAAASLGGFVLSSLAALNQNDFMYAVAPAVWAQNGALYTDVPFPQAPLSILLNSLLVAISGNVNIFLFARIVSMSLVLLAILLPVLDRSKVRDIEIWLLYVSLCLTNYFLISNSREIGNYALSLLCLSAAVTILGASGPAKWRGFAAFMFIGLATSAKLYFIVILPALFLWFVINERKARSPGVVAACGAGLVAGLAPILFFLARDYESFWRWTVQFFQLIMPLRLTGAADALRRVANMLMLFAALMAIPIGFFIAATWTAWRQGGVALREKSAQLLLLAATCAMAISPVILFGQYFGPLAFLLLLFSAPWRPAGDQLQFRYKIFAGAMLAIQGVIVVGIVGPDVVRGGDLVVAEVLDAQRTARRIVASGYRCERKLYTTVPLFLLENNIKYPPELAAGPFLMIFLRGDSLVQKGLAFDVDAHLGKWDPDIVIWGYFLGSHDPAEDAVDRSIRDYAISHSFSVTSLGKVDGHEIKLGYRAGCR
jgi:hypothetical protein